MSESMLCAACRVGSRLLDRILTRPDTTLQGRVAEDKEGIRSISVSGFKEEKERERKRVLGAAYGIANCGFALINVNVSFKGILGVC